MGQLRHPAIKCAVSDSLWKRIRPILDGEGGIRIKGRPHADRRLALEGIIFRLRTGCSWNRLPPSFGDDSTIYRHFRRWQISGIFALVWELLLEECQDLASVDWGGRSPGLVLSDAAKGELSGGDAAPADLSRARL